MGDGRVDPDKDDDFPYEDAVKEGESSVARIVDACRATADCSSSAILANRLQRARKAFR